MGGAGCDPVSGSLPLVQWDLDLGGTVWVRLAVGSVYAPGGRVADPSSGVCRPDSRVDDRGVTNGKGA